jgi:hypothetical protein
LWAYYKRESIAEMENIEVVELLREIRDLQKLHLAKHEEFTRNQQIALEQQRESMAVQKKASRLQRSALLIILIVGILALGLIILIALLKEPTLTQRTLEATLQ